MKFFFLILGIFLTLSLSAQSKDTIAVVAAKAAPAKKSTVSFACTGELMTSFLVKNGNGFALGYGGPAVKLQITKKISFRFLMYPSVVYKETNQKPIISTGTGVALSYDRFSLLNPWFYNLDGQKKWEWGLGFAFKF